MKFYISNTRSVIEGTPEEIGTLQETIGFFQKTRNVLGYFTNVWRSFVIRSKDPTRATLLTGLALEFLGKNPHIEFEDLREHLDLKYHTPQEVEGLTLRDYQREAIEAVIQHKRGIIGIATGGGKTATAASIIKTIGKKTLFIVHRKDLLYQTAKVFKEKIPEFTIGLFGDGIYNTQEDIIIAMIQSLDKFSKSNSKEFKSELGNREVLLLDELHRAQSTQWSRVITKCNSYFRIGLSGTPEGRNDGQFMKLVGHTGSILHRLKNDDLISEGYLSKPTIKIIDLKIPKIIGYDWHDIYKKGIIQCEARNNKIVEIAIASANQNKPTLVFVEKLEHGKLLMDKLKGAGENAQFLHGKTDSYTRNKLKERLQTQGGQVFVVTPIWDEGVDVPAIRTAILAPGMKSPIRLLQRIGRGLRLKSDGDNTVEIYDFTDFHHKILYKHFKERLNVYREEKFTIELI